MPHFYPRKLPLHILNLSKTCLTSLHNSESFCTFICFVVCVNFCLTFFCCFNKLLLISSIMKFVVLFILVFPYNKRLVFLHESHMQILQLLLQDCKSFRIQTNQMNAIINACFGITSIILIGISKSPKTIQTPKVAIEKRLILQILTSPISLSLLYGLNLVSAYAIDPLQEFTVAAYFAYLCQFYPPMFLLFYVSVVFRNKFIEFLKVSFLFSKKNCITF